MDGPALLELGDLAVGDPCGFLEFALGEAGAGGDLAAEAVGEALPEVPGVVVEEDRPGVVVGVGVERGAEGVVVGAVGGARSGSGRCRGGCGRGRRTGR